MNRRRWSRPSVLPEERRALDVAIRGAVPVRYLPPVSAEAAARHGGVFGPSAWRIDAWRWFLHVRRALGERLAGVAGGAEW